MRALALWSFLLWSGAVHAHKASNAYLALEVKDSRSVEGRLELALADLEEALGLDRDGDGAITWGELRAAAPRISTYALARLHLSTSGSECPSRFSGLSVDRHGDGAYAVLALSFQCAREIDAVAVGYRLFFDRDARHRGLLRLSAAGTLRTAVLGPDDPPAVFALSAPASSTGFVLDGVHHIWTGWDHLAFLLALLLPSVLQRRGGRWLPAPGFAPAFLEVAKVVTSFTIAHSITLSLSALHVVQLPSRLVESTIALSVGVAALNNLWPLLHGRAFALAFGFGLLHGLGFASVLGDLSLSGAPLLRALLSFNLGVELGQLAVVGALFSLAFAARRSPLYPRALVAGSCALVLTSTVWVIERAGGVQSTLATDRAEDSGVIRD
jgi:HupE / UreJ protein